MVNSIGTTSQMPQMQRQQIAMSSEKKEQVQEVLSQFDSENLSANDASSITESFKELGIAANLELKELMTESGFDAENIGEMAGVTNKQMPPPPQHTTENSSDIVSFLDQILEDFNDKLSEDDKASIMSALQDKFSLGKTDSLVDVQA